jgi:hypothetical protein
MSRILALVFILVVSAAHAEEATKPKFGPDWYVPYWTSTATLLAALVKPAPADESVLAGATGGYILVAKT